MVLEVIWSARTCCATYTGRWHACTDSGLRFGDLAIQQPKLGKTVSNFQRLFSDYRIPLLGESKSMDGGMVQSIASYQLLSYAHTRQTMTSTTIRDATDD